MQRGLSRDTCRSCIGGHEVEFSILPQGSEHQPPALLRWANARGDVQRQCQSQQQWKSRRLKSRRLKSRRLSRRQSRHLSRRQNAQKMKPRASLIRTPAPALSTVGQIWTTSRPFRRCEFTRGLPGACQVVLARWVRRRLRSTPTEPVPEADTN